VVPENGAVELQVTLAGADGSVGIYSRPGYADGDIEWTRHAYGALGAAVEPSVSGLHQWPPAADELDVSEVYGHFADLGIDYGPAFQGLTAAWRNGDDVYAAIALPGEYHDDASTFGIHPALLDAALQSGLLAAPGGEAVQARLLFAWGGVTLHKVGAAVLRVRLNTIADGVALVATDERGDLVVTADSLAMLPVTSEQIGAAVPSMGEGSPSRDLLRRNGRRARADRADRGALATQLAAVPGAEQVDHVATVICREIAAVLGHAEHINRNHTFKDLGFNSMRAVELRNRLNAVTGLRLPPTLIFDYPTTSDLAVHIHDVLAPKSPSPDLGIDDAIAALRAGIEATTMDAAIKRMALEHVDSIVDVCLKDSGAAADERDIDSATDDQMFDLIAEEFGIS
jgi:acyl transferase domain-containing protein